MPIEVRLRLDEVVVDPAPNEGEDSILRQLGTPTVFGDFGGAPPLAAPLGVMDFAATLGVVDPPWGAAPLGVTDVVAPVGSAPVTSSEAQGGQLKSVIHNR